MRRLYSILTIGLLAVACVKEQPAIRGFEMDAAEIVMGCEGGTSSVTVRSEGEWTAVASEPWVMISPANGIGETRVGIAVDTTLVKTLRSAMVSFSVGGKLQKQLAVSQTGHANVISIAEPDVKVEAFRESSKRSITAKVIANVPFRVSTDASWLKLGDVKVVNDAGSRPRSATMKIEWKVNSVPEERVAVVNFVPEDSSVQLESPAVLTITQEAAPKIEDNRAGDSLAVVLINDRLGVSNIDDYSENMRNWENVALWDALDEGLPCKEAIGRIRAVRFYLFSTDDPLPDELSHLKYLQTLDFYSNVNCDRKSLDLGTSICGLQYLKYLEVGAYGLVSLPDELVNLGPHLVNLNLNSNCFNEIPDILTPENFPALKALNLATNRRISYLTDLRTAPEHEYRGGIGLYVDADQPGNPLERLLRWDNLEELTLSYNCFEGHLPDFEEEDVPRWEEEDVQKWGGDSIKYLAVNHIPKILPNARHIALNLNFFTGNAPRWLMYHPRLLDMAPSLLIFNQQEYGRNSRGELVRFDNEPENFEYYFEAFPLFRDKYTFEEEYEE